MKYVAITSMNLQYFEHSGRAMIKSFSSRFDENIPLHIYNEGFHSIKFKNTQLMGWELGDEYDRFQQRWNSNNKIQGFAKKAFSIIHAMNNIECDRLIWFDADIIIDKRIPLQLLELISPSSVLSTHYGVMHDWPSDTDPSRKSFSCETGFFILNKRHEKFNDFKEMYTKIYVNDLHSSIRRFYDGEVYGETVRVLEQSGAKMLDLNPGNTHKTPIPRSIMAPYISHHKAGLKDTIDYVLIEKDIDENG
jgi:hypothetical protein